MLSVASPTMDGRTASYHDMRTPGGVASWQYRSDLRSSAATQVRHRTYTVNGLPTNGSMWELQNLLLGEDWVETEEFTKRCGFCAMSGVLPGITSQLFVVRDIYGVECGEADSEAEAKSLIAEMTRDSALQQKYTVEAVWDEKGPMRYDKQELMMHVQNSLAAMARACDAVDRSGAGSFVVCDLFNLPASKLEELTSSDARLVKFLCDAPVREPLLMLQKALSKNGSLAVIMPMPEAMMQKQLPVLRKIFPSRILVAVAHGDYRPSNLSLQLLVALTTAAGAEAPRRALAVFVGGSDRELSHMAFCARHNVRLLLLEGSGRLCELLGHLWPSRSSIPFDPVGMRSRLSVTFARPAEADSVDDLRILLSQGEVVIHPLAGSTAKLDRLCVQLLTGDKVLLVAQGAADKYVSTSRSYSRPNYILTNLSIAIGLLSTIVAVVAGEFINDKKRIPVPWKRQLFAGDHKALEVDDVLLFVCASLPVLLAVVDSIEGLMNTAEATAAVERAAGLVTQSIYLYRCRAGDYSDVALNRASRNSGETSSDLSTLRQTLLQQDLATIAQVVDASGALLTTSESGQQQRPLFEIGTTALDAAGYTTAPSPPWYAKLMPWTASSAPTAADFALAPLRSLAHLPAAQKAETIDGDGYVHERVLPELERNLSNARCQLLLVVLARVSSFAAAAVGTAIAVAAFTSTEERWEAILDPGGVSPSAVAITVAVMTALSRMLQTTRIEAQRRAHTRAASALNAARVRWEALPSEERGRQAELDRLVLSVEQAIEATLPPATSDVAARKASSAARVMRPA